MTYQPRVYRKQGGNELVVAAGGKVSVEAGGELAHAAGALALSQRFRVTAAEVNAGKELLAADQKADDKFLTGINFFVAGVEGKVPGTEGK